MTRERALTVLMITHKLREVTAFADSVSVLRRGILAGGGPVARLGPAALGELMVGGRELPRSPDGTRVSVRPDAEAVLQVHDLRVDDDRGLPAVKDVTFAVRSGEIVGIAGVSGNGQRQLVEALVGQRRVAGGEIRVGARPYHATRGEIRERRTFSLPEEPLRNACVPGMSFAENLAFRTFDQAPLTFGPWIRRRAMREHADRLLTQFRVQAPGPDVPIATLSGGNVQRAVLARELSRPASVLVAVNPVFGLDFTAVEEIHHRLVAARNGGTAVLLVSEDLDELLELSDRILVMFDGRIVHETSAPSADIAVIGRCMAGHPAGAGLRAGGAADRETSIPAHSP
jgi:simple sugar transport system ATP-binding protein